MASFNKVILMGRLTATPELKQTPSNVSVTTFTVAVDRRFARSGEGQETADFITVVAWRQTAEFVCRYFKKGRPILVCGSIQTRSWTDQQGNKRYVTEVVADEVSFVESKADSDAHSGADDNANSSARQNRSQQQYTPDAYGAPAYSNGSDSDFEELPGDDNLPF